MQDLRHRSANHATLYMPTRTKLNDPLSIMPAHKRPPHWCPPDSFQELPFLWLGVKQNICGMLRLVIYIMYI
uniref:Uncharacterized protein n=1 Tax=Setaria italica TaxID=4555 RepID=K3ZBH2_SETIT